MSHLTMMHMPETSPRVTSKNNTAAWIIGGIILLLLGFFFLYTTNNSVQDGPYSSTSTETSGTVFSPPSTSPLPSNESSTTSSGSSGVSGSVVIGTSKFSFSAVFQDPVTGLAFVVPGIWHPENYTVTKTIATRADHDSLVYRLKIERMADGNVPACTAEVEVREKQRALNGENVLLTTAKYRVHGQETCNGYFYEIPESL